MAAHSDDALRIVPASHASIDELEAVFDRPGDQRSCRCQWFMHDRAGYRAMSPAARAEALRAQAGCGDEQASTSGLLAFVDGEPAAWVAVEPRAHYVRMRSMRIPWLGRDEDPDDDGVWAITCFVVRREHRGRGLTRALAIAAVDHARSHGAAAVEGYPRVVEPGATLGGELYVGPVSAFAAAGMSEVSAPTPKRRVMRIDL